LSHMMDMNNPELFIKNADSFSTSSRAIEESVVISSFLAKNMRLRQE